MKARYGSLPSQKAILERRLKGDVVSKEKKYFDSADWAQGLPANAHTKPGGESSSTSATPEKAAETILEQPPTIQ